jgi:hypothetical protein
MGVMSEEKKAEQDERVAFEAEWKRSGWGDADTKNQCFHFWQARAASTSANVAQGAEALGWAWERRYLNGGYSRKFCVSEFDARELAKDGENLPAHDLVYPFYAAPPAQTAITDDARDATKPEAPALLGGRDRLLADSYRRRKPRPIA